MNVTQLSDEELQKLLDTWENEIQQLEFELAEFRQAAKDQILLIRADYDLALLEKQRRDHVRRNPTLDQTIGG
jgi:hypothetical protein